MRTCIACLLVVLAAAPATAPAADKKPPPRPGVLWQQYPLGKKRLTGKTPTTPAPATPAPKTPPQSAPKPPVRPSVTSPVPAAKSGRSSGTYWSTIALAAGGGIAALALVGALYLRLRRETPVSVEEPMVMIALAAARLESRRRSRGAPHIVPPGLTMPPTRERRRAVNDKLDERLHDEVSAGQEGRATHALGDKVSDVIRAAEELAEQIRADAEEEARQIKGRADQSHAAAMTVLAKERDELRAAAEADAAEIRRAGELYATDHRRAAEAETAKVVAEAETQARAMREAAEQMSMQIETTALRRREELEERTSLVETRLRRFQTGLREIANELDGLLEPPRGNSDVLREAFHDGDEASEQPAEQEGARTDNRR